MFFKIVFCLAGGGGFTLISWGLYFIKGILTFFFVLWWKFNDICLTFTHSLTHFFCVLCRGVSVGRCAFLFLDIHV